MRQKGNSSSPQLFGEQAIAQSYRSSNCNLTFPAYQDLLSKIARISGIRLRLPCEGLHGASRPGGILTRRHSEGFASTFRRPRARSMVTRRASEGSRRPFPAPRNLKPANRNFPERPTGKIRIVTRCRFGLGSTVSYNKNSGLSALLTTSLSRRRWRPLHEHKPQMRAFGGR
jgi:hypothetical protein